MATPVELRHLCLLLSAGSMVYHKRGATLPAAMRCALYLLLAFALRRGNLGRDLLRGATSHSHHYPAAPRPRPSLRTTLTRWAAPLTFRKDKHGSPYLSCI
jgi:hypothetical protein